MGNTSVPNPDFSPTNGQTLIVTRDFGFGAAVGMVSVGGQMLTVIEWNNPGTLGPMNPAEKLLAGFFQYGGP